MARRSTSRVTTFACTMRQRRIIGHFGIQRDVTEEVRLQAEVARHAAELETRVVERTAELARSEARIRAIVNALPDVVFVLDGDGRAMSRSSPTMDDASCAARPNCPAAVCTTCCPKPRRLRLSKLRGRRSRPETFRCSSTPLRALTESAGSKVARRRCASMAPTDEPTVVVIARDITDRKRADELERQNVYLREAFETDLHFGEIHGRIGGDAGGLQGDRARRRHRFVGAAARRHRDR